LLGGKPYHYSEATIGLFGLVGLGGALAAQFAGRMADRGKHHMSTGLFFGLMLVSWAAIAAGSTSLAALIVGIAVLDLGVQGAQITSQSVIYALDPAARSRLTTAYMTTVFASAAVFSALASAIYDSGGWSAVSLLGAALAAAGIVVWGAEQLVRRRREHPRADVPEGDVQRAAS
jgi:MFS family permease